MKNYTLVVLSTWLGLVSMVAAESPKVDPKVSNEATRQYVNELLELGKPGVHFRGDIDVKDGEFLRIYVIGSSPISTALGLEEGLEIAQERAEESAKTQFVQSLGSKVTLRKSVNNQIILTKEGEEGGGAEGVKEQAKKIERRTKEYEESASSIVKGLKVVGAHQNAKDKKYVVVYRWEAKLVDSLDRVNEKLNTVKEKAAPALVEPKAVVPVPPAKPDPSKVVPEKKIIID